MNPEIRYESCAADAFFPLELTISSQGLATLRVGSNRDKPQVSNAGVFEARLVPPQYAKLVAALRAPAFSAIENPGPLYPGAVVRTLKIQEQGREEVMRYVGESGPTPPAFASAEAEALEVAAIVRQHPVQAVAMRVGALPTECRRGQAIELSVTFANPGAQPIQLHHPSAWSEQTATLDMVGLRSDIPLAELRDHHRKVQPLEQKTLERMEPTQEDGPRIPLAPGKHVTLTFRVTPDWPQGRYAVQLCFASAILDERGEEVMRFEVLSAKFPFTASD